MCFRPTSFTTSINAGRANKPVSVLVLQFTNPWKEKFYFQNLGMQWPHDPSKRLIELTTSKITEATPFDDAETAKAVLVAAGRPLGWEIVPRP